MALLYYDFVFAEHDTGDHPESAGRILPAIRHLQFVGLDTACQRPAWDSASLERVSRVHSRQYIEAVESFCNHQGGRIEADTVVSAKSYNVALRAAGAVCDAVTRVVAGEDRRAFCIVRPPGHHALRDAAMGFCLFNNVAIGARQATSELGIDRVLIIDWDVHHGNGTQATFWEDPQVGFLSIHRWPFYPGTGAADETGAGNGVDTTLNLPIAFGTPRVEYLSIFRRELERFARRIRPQLVLVSAGFDSHRADPIGSLGLESEDFAIMTQSVIEVAEAYAQGRLVSVLEGGYNPAAMSECLTIHLEGLLAGGRSAD
jgi:acetoin utilization deacetylase AcuC-like enzyme